MIMKQQELCHIKFSKNRIAETCVCHHHDNVSCNFNPFTDTEDELHCILKFCSEHAGEFRLIQEGDSIKGLDIQFKDKKHHSHL